MEEQGSANASVLNKPKEVLMAVYVDETMKYQVGSPLLLLHTKVYVKLKGRFDGFGSVELSVGKFEIQVKDQYYSAMSVFL